MNLKLLDLTFRSQVILQINCGKSCSYTCGDKALCRRVYDSQAYPVYLSSEEGQQDG